MLIKFLIIPAIFAICNAYGTDKQYTNDINNKEAKIEREIKSKQNKNSVSYNSYDIDITDESGISSLKVETPSILKSGWYSGADFGLHKTKLTLTELKNNAMGEKQNDKHQDGTDKNMFNSNIIIGYDCLLGRLLLGGECGVSLYMGSKINYRFPQSGDNIVSLNRGTGYTGAVKVGIALGSIVLYGKVGGQLNRWKYEQVNRDLPLDKKFKVKTLWGGGIEKQFSNSLYIRAEYIQNMKIGHDINVTHKDYKFHNIQTGDYQISVGGGYRF